MDLQNNVNELITLRTSGVEDAMKSMKDIESLFDRVTSNHRPLLNGERYLSDVEVSHRLKVSRRTLQDYRDNETDVLAIVRHPSFFVCMGLSPLLID